jgi:hypothetical protein
MMHDRQGSRSSGEAGPAEVCHDSAVEPWCEDHSETAMLIGNAAVFSMMADIRITGDDFEDIGGHGVELLECDNELRGNGFAGIGGEEIHDEGRCAVDPGEPDAGAHPPTDAGGSCGIGR